MNTTAIAPQKTCEKDQRVLRELWAAFMENYNAFKDGQMLMKDEYKYKLISSPGPSQYRAFLNLFRFFKNEERIVEEQNFWEYLYMYDWLFMNEESEPAMLHFIRNLNSPDFARMVKKIVVAFGSFWHPHLPTREKIILLLNELSKKGVDVRIYAQAQEDEDYMEKLNESIKINSRFGLKKRIPIHYVRAGDYVFLEFPHTETTEFRLNWLVDLNSMEYKWYKTKGGLVRYFDSLIEGAL